MMSLSLIERKFAKYFAIRFALFRSKLSNPDDVDFAVIKDDEN